MILDTNKLNLKKTKNETPQKIIENANEKWNMI